MRRPAYGCFRSPSAGNCPCGRRAGIPGVLLLAIITRDLNLCQANPQPEILLHHYSNQHQEQGSAGSQKVSLFHNCYWIRLFENGTDEKSMDGISACLMILIYKP